jgi:hypothetical protein
MPGMKLPHWAQLALGLAHVIIVWLIAQNASGNLTLAATVVTLLVVVDKTIALLTDSVPSALAAKRARLAAVKISGVFLLLVGASGCTPSTGGQVVTTIPPAVALVECVYQHVDGCIQAHTPWPACTLQTAEACGTDVPTIVSIWASKRAAEAREGDAGASYP